MLSESKKTYGNRNPQTRIITVFGVSQQARTIKTKGPSGCWNMWKLPPKQELILISYHIQRKSRQVTRVRNASVLRSYMFSSWFEWWSVISSWKFSIWRGVFGISLCGTQKHLETLENVGVRNCDFRKATVIPCNSDIEMPFFGIWANYIKRL